MLLDLNTFTITDDGEAHSPTQISVGDGGQIIAHGDGSLEVATGAAGFAADGTLILPDLRVQGIATAPLPPTHFLVVRDSAGNYYQIPVARIDPPNP